MREERGRGWVIIWFEVVCFCWVMLLVMSFNVVVLLGLEVRILRVKGGILFFLLRVVVGMGVVGWEWDWGVGGDFWREEGVRLGVDGLEDMVLWGRMRLVWRKVKNVIDMKM